MSCFRNITYRARTLRRGTQRPTRVYYDNDSAHADGTRTSLKNSLAERYEKLNNIINLSGRVTWEKK